MMAGPSISPSDWRAIRFALDELEAYVSAVGEADDSYDRHIWTIRKLTALLEKYDPEDSEEQ